MSLLTFFQDEIENLWKHAVKISLGRARGFLEIGFAFGNWFAKISQKMLHNTSSNLTVPRIKSA